MIEPYKYRGSGEVHGEAVPKSPGLVPAPPRQNLADRARTAARLAAQDPSWGERSTESRRLLVNLALKEARDAKRRND